MAYQLLITEGVVRSVGDDSQIGRIKVYCPEVDSPDVTDEELPWAWYVSPFFGVTNDVTSGPTEAKNSGPSPYGFWSLPKIGARVLIVFVNHDPNYRCYIGGMVPHSLARGLPAGRWNGSHATTESGSPREPAASNARDAGVSADLTRGPYERQIAQPKTNKDGAEGYFVNDGGMESETFAWTSPRGHYITMQDHPTFCRLRIKTTTGKQLLLDDTNERIYCSTASGKAYFEMDEAGHFFFYGAKSGSLTFGEDFNVTAGGSIYMKAGADFNVTATGTGSVTAANINLKASGSILETAATIGLTGSAGTQIDGGASLDLTGGKIVQTGGRIDLNGPPAAKPKSATAAKPPTITPQHEPWTRPAAGPRNPHWKAR